MVQVLSSRSTQDPHLAHLLWSLFFFQAYFRFEIAAFHIAGKKNQAADALSRNKYFLICPQAGKHLVAIPMPLLELLLSQSLSLEGIVCQLFAKGIAANTRATYSSAQRRYREKFGISVLPLTDCSLCLFAAFLANEGLCAQSISVYLSAIRHLQISTGMQPPPWPWLPLGVSNALSPLQLGFVFLLHPQFSLSCLVLAASFG